MTLRLEWPCCGHIQVRETEDDYFEIHARRSTQEAGTRWVQDEGTAFVLVDSYGKPEKMTHNIFSDDYEKHHTNDYGDFEFEETIDSEYEYQCPHCESSRWPKVLDTDEAPALVPPIPDSRVSVLPSGVDAGVMLDPGPERKQTAAEKELDSILSEAA